MPPNSYCGADCLQLSVTGAAVHINRGVNGRWTEALTEADIRAYERRARVELGEDCARWLATGKLTQS